VSAAWSSGSTSAWRRTRAAVLARDGWTCQHCGRHIHPRCLVTGCPTCAHVDHVTPRSRGGSDDPSNLVASCARCNLGRGDRQRHPANALAAATLRTSRAW
jgi:5-methylcytosine-specific restriction endonuclease McrA